jgi:hypothetical protein
VNKKGCREINNMKKTGKWKYVGCETFTRSGGQHIQSLDKTLVKKFIADKKAKSKQKATKC